ncbi:MAG TPA: hypothetical protein VGR91_08825 [Stellaceae bacterium]|nr:hypothetical protein [Stellaceae bacterium]
MSQNSTLTRFSSPGEAAGAAAVSPSSARSGPTGTVPGSIRGAAQ